MTPDGDLAGRLRMLVPTDEDAAAVVEVVRAAGWGPGTAAMREAVRELAGALSQGRCLFWACEGPLVEPVAMVTCRACWATHDLLTLLGEVLVDDADPQSPQWAESVLGKDRRMVETVLAEYGLDTGNNPTGNVGRALAALLAQARTDGERKGQEAEREHWQPLLAEECARSRDLRARLRAALDPAALLIQARADGVEEGRGDMERLERERAESAPWLLDLVHAAETAGTELGCNGDHEGNEGCDGCAWEALAAAVPARVRNAADEAASKP